jgi:hypothetical protein
MSKQSELFDRAAECERLRNLETDKIKKTTFRLLRDMWIVLANEIGTMPAEHLAKEIARIEEIQEGRHNFREGLDAVGRLS